MQNQTNSIDNLLIPEKSIPQDREDLLDLLRANPALTDENKEIDTDKLRELFLAYNESFDRLQQNMGLLLGAGGFDLKESVCINSIEGEIQGTAIGIANDGTLTVAIENEGNTLNAVISSVGYPDKEHQSDRQKAIYSLMMDFITDFLLNE